MDQVYNINDELSDDQYGYGLDSNARLNNGIGNSGGSTALYHHNGTRYGLGLSGRAAGADAKMNGLHGPKHKRGDVDRKFNSPLQEAFLTEPISQPVCRYSSRGPCW